MSSETELSQFLGDFLPTLQYKLSVWSGGAMVLGKTSSAYNLDDSRARALLRLQ